MSTDNLVPQIPLPPGSGLVQGGGLGFSADDIKPSPVELVNTDKDRDEDPTLQFGFYRDKESNMYLGDEKGAVQCIPLAFRTGRVLFPPGKTFGLPALCRSWDGIKPAEGVPEKQAALCASCVKSSWQNFKKSTGEGVPDCKETMTLLFLERTTGLPYLYTVKKKALPEMKNLKKTLTKYHLMSKGKGEVLNIFDFTFVMRSTKIAGGQGSKYYIPNFSGIMAVKPEDRGKFGPLYESLVVMRAAAMDRAVQQEEAATQEQEYVDA